MNKRGVFFSTDALIALMIIFLVVMIVYPIGKYHPYKSELPGDIIKVLSAMKIGKINSPYVQQLISEGKINDMNKSVLEQIGDFYVSNVTKASELANAILSELNTSENIGIWYNSDLLASKNSTSYEGSKNVEVERQVISGIEKGKISQGFVAKAWLKKINKKKTTLVVRGDLMCGRWGPFFGGEYCGIAQTTINYSFFIPLNATIINAWWLAEPSWINQPTALFVNNMQVFSGQIQFFRIINITSYLHIGDNIAQLRGDWGGEDGASHIVVEYETPDLQTFELQNIFPFNQMTTTGILYHEKALFISDPLSSMQVRINTTAQTRLEIRKGSKNVTIGIKTPVNQLVVFDNSEIQTALNNEGMPYSSLKDQYLFFILKIGTNGQANVNIRNNSYVQINTSSHPEVPFGAIDITQEIKIKDFSNMMVEGAYRNLLWEFYLPKNSIPVYTDWQFGWISTGESSQEVRANSVVLYQSPPEPFIIAFSRYAYTNQTKPGVFKEGLNDFTLSFGGNYGVSNNASFGSLLFFIRNFVEYGDAKEKARGGIRSVEFEDGSTKEIDIGDSSDLWDPETDAVDDAVERLLSQLDSDNDSRIDLIIDQDSMDIDTLDISGVPYIWSTEVQVRRWR